ncbi:MAG: CDP-alcohol phosphatidyltransferase family protein [Bacteroidales bacterium]|jgi:CDP-diacylglycerol---serine O-phosphatidyltransferase|nr:CDP-alcohol phosphatidyltransferase family protein [Bacteroidales bacterium]MDD2204317.1 CDP-alcohol phosphatidyltransferase family protein [Bacteroidales bacterium]MDD3151760.1 CDP-alcohol phosphatidyltransferase family protein [Bacteroidales bacterium]MDD3913198.1 CDP-alcohol phosphatidyltransferase family protein [Bacteroidales bacterium]MDD4633113.1 CDP-alcohol phosphatidyltransferase family protein [Bacteroidales bacterium]
MSNNKIKAFIPNVVTLLNLISGSVGIILLLTTHNVLYACFCMFASAIFDFCDGTVARLLKVQSNIGKELDSLSDIISFGLLPGIIMYNLMTLLPLPYGVFSKIFPFLSLLIPAFAAIRLARFNVSKQNLVVFYGLSSPGAAFLIASLAINSYIVNFLTTRNVILSAIIIIVIILIVCALMVSNIKFLTLKFKGLSFKYNYINYCLLVVSAILLILLELNALIIIFALYVILSLIFSKQKTQ